ncbi:MAG: QcrA and Rieske domain-containing protein [Candidatus Aminicenantia bacterium]
MKRRKIIDYIIGSSFIAVLGTIFYPILKFVFPPKISESTQSTVNVGKVDDIHPNSGKIFRFGSKPGLIVRKSDGSFIALSATCTHLGCIVQYRADLGHIWCACHNGHFDLSGKVLSGPPPSPLQEFKVKIVGDEIYVVKE